MGDDRQVGPDPVVGQGLHIRKLVPGQLTDVAEVEAQALRGHQRPGLPHVWSQYGTKGGVQDVGAAVVARRVRPSFRVHRRPDRVAHGNFALLDHASLDDQSGDGALRVFHPHHPVGAADVALVAQLAATLGVEGGTVDDHLGLLAQGRMAHRNAVYQQGGHHRLLLGQAIAGELAAARAQVLVGGEHFHAAREGLGGAGLLTLRLHLPFEAVHIDIQAVLPGDFGRQLRREPVGVVEDEGVPSRNRAGIGHLARTILPGGDHVEENFVAAAVGLCETLLLQPDHP